MKKYLKKTDEVAKEIGNSHVSYISSNLIYLIQEVNSASGNLLS